MTGIAFVGLGHMGLPMARNLLKAGHNVYGFDLQSPALEHFKAAGGKVCHNLAEVARDRDVLITMLQTGHQVKQVCLDEKGLFAHAKTAALYIDCSSIDVQTSREIHVKARERGLLAVDAPVSGGVAGAEAATLTFMVGGEDEAFKTAEEWLKVMGKTIIHTGGAGSGQAAKICNNMILGISMIAVSEAFTLAQQLGLSAKKLFEVVNHASGQCWVMSKYPPLPNLLDNVPANKDYQPGFSAQMMLKDLNLSQDSAQTVTVNTPLAAKAREIYQQFIDKGLGHLDFSAIITAIDQSMELSK
ncbi:3-hydroxyisobutyrate dehydrogenase [Legionella israelensis]|uniref:3-hydroxyisobutyrate dehydrogenase n=1 Tax=Legionella israelensis TaxID=454 RepID=UPI00117CBAAA|nr:3-hydroxyisobutyrate dehydrogenase [Legionella israelensis]QDP71348.1 3-hydroxyisobutyrate dehydrogenase [Legionella israelensis]